MSDPDLSPGSGRCAEPAYDPDLPPRVHEELQFRHDELLRADDEPRWTRELGARQRYVEAVAGIILSIVPALSAFGMLTHFFVPLVIVGGTVLVVAGFSYHAFAGLLALAAVVLSGVLGTWMGFQAIVLTLTTGVWLLCVFFSLRYAWRNADERIPHVHKNRYVVASDLYPAENALLVRMQDVVDVTEAAQEVLGDLFDGDTALRSLREQEWALATLFLRQSRLAADLERREREAVSEVVLRSLEPQRTSLERVRGNAEERVSRIESYGRFVADAMVKQREWEQVRENMDHDDATGSCCSMPRPHRNRARPAPGISNCGRCGRAGTRVCSRRFARCAG
ncbi:hypothetical protein GCM10007147_26060 [Nocardiopsis kunsanensis]|uniref:Uncharacterized protein n=1 Tax=Nocardiopsis kunsanensis TaxID=141693 RepID=A0A918XDM7_9ACTN|nr:hypothetical protein [Nocardiopsis kunsanensis]GHD27200.1 hypothetical protein GCM10007147_26060 [Nocardiopsis kunsanensis]